MKRGEWPKGVARVFRGQEKHAWTALLLAIPKRQQPSKKGPKKTGHRCPAFVVKK
jgi:hypothetical protein